MQSRKHLAGFVLIEMMVVAGLIGILLSVLVPSYQHWVLQSHRREATQELLRLAHLQQLLFIEQSRYSADLTELGFADREYVLPSGRFRISARLIANGYQLSAEAVAMQRQDTGCLQLTLDHLGLRHSTPTLDCWR
jgi:type IV pilus assembly protein PilE